jgi:hypothetical protein
LKQLQPTSQKNHRGFPKLPPKGSTEKANWEGKKRTDSQLPLPSIDQKMQFQNITAETRKMIKDIANTTPLLHSQK